MKHSVIIGVDLSLRGTGIVAWRVRSQRVLSSTLVSTKVNRLREYDFQARLDYLVCSVMVIVQEHVTPLVAIEDAAFMARHSNTRQHELSGVVKYALWQAEVPFVLCASTALKRTATGNGRATKDDMVAAACGAGFQTTDDNLADAYWCARHAADVQRVMA